jgi:hypothetical protein
MTLEVAYEDAFRSAVGVLHTLGARYAAIGGLARNAWGTVRATTDLDFALAAGSGELEHATEKLHASGFLTDRAIGPADPADSLPDIVFVRARSGDGVRLDLLIAKTPFEIQAVGRAQTVFVLGAPCRVITPEDLVVYKLIAFRPRDRLDIEDVIDVQSAKHGVDIAHIDRWAEEWGLTERWVSFRARAVQRPPER